MIYCNRQNWNIPSLAFIEEFCLKIILESKNCTVLINSGINNTIYDEYEIKPKANV